MNPPPSDPPSGAPPIPPNVPPQPEALALRAKPRPVTRLSRRALILLGSVSAITVGGLAIWALGVQHGGGTPPQELYSTDRKPIAEGLNTLPRDYAALPRPALPAGVPPLGPPLPGDLGRPFLRAATGAAARLSRAQLRLRARPRRSRPLPPNASGCARRRRRHARGALFVQVRQRASDQPAASEPAVADRRDAGQPIRAAARLGRKCAPRRGRDPERAG